MATQAFVIFGLSSLMYTVSALVCFIVNMAAGTPTITSAFQNLESSTGQVKVKMTAVTNYLKFSDLKNINTTDLVSFGYH